MHFMSYIPNEVNDSSVHSAVDNRTECSGRRCLADSPLRRLLPFGSLRAHLRTIDFVVRRREDTRPSGIAPSWAVRQSGGADSVKCRSTPHPPTPNYASLEILEGGSESGRGTVCPSRLIPPSDHIASFSAAKRWMRVIT